MMLMSIFMSYVGGSTKLRTRVGRASSAAMLQQERLALDELGAFSLLPPSGAMLSRDAVVVVDGLFPPTQIAQMEHTLIDLLQYRLCDLAGTMVAELPSGSAVLPPYPQGEASDAAKSAWVAASTQAWLVDDVAARVLPSVRALAGADDHQLRRAHASLCRRGDHPRPRRGAPATVTALVFPNARWGAADGGEHVFFHDGEIVRSVRPRPGRVILWAGAVQHAARPPLPDARDPRLSIGLEWAI